MCAKRMQRLVRFCRYEALASVVKIDGISLPHQHAASDSSKGNTHSAIVAAFLTRPTMSTTNTTASASGIRFFTSSRNLGCPGRSTSLTCLLLSSKLITVELGTTEVCVWG